MKRHTVRCSCQKVAQGLATGEDWVCKECGRGFRVEWWSSHGKYGIVAQPVDRIARDHFKSLPNIVLLKSYESQF